MEDFTTEKDYSDPQHPKLIYQIRKNPLVYGMDGSDPLDKFPWKKITDGNKGYSAGVIGMMMAATSAILRLKGVDRRIVIYNSKDTLLGDPYFELACQIVDEIPPEFSGSVDYSDETKQDPGILAHFDLSSLEDLFKDPKQFVADNLAIIIRKYLKMEPYEFFDHFANFEDDVYRIFGYLLVHGLNEKFRMVEAFMKSDEGKKFVGYLVREYQKNIFNYIPDGVIEDWRLNFIALLDTRLAPPHMVENFKKIDKTRMVELFFEGISKAVVNFGVDFDSLKEDIWQELEESMKTGDLSGNLRKTDADIEEQVKKIKEFYAAIAIFSMVVTQSIIGINHAVISASGEFIAQSAVNNELTADKIKESFDKITESLKNIDFKALRTKSPIESEESGDSKKD